MSSKRLLTIFGSTGLQGGSIIDVVLAHPQLQQKYRLRGITRDPSSSKSRALASKGVEMVKAELNDLASLKQAVRGSYGVFGVTDFWSVMNKEIEIQQGKNIFDAVKADGVKHYVWSSLPYAEKLTNGDLKHVDHFDSKAVVEEYVKANQGDMIASFNMPAMYFPKAMIKSIYGVPTLTMPFADSIAWPLIEPQLDNGKYVMGLFEGSEKANGARVHAVSTWTTPRDLVAALSRETGKEVVFKTVPKEVFASFLPEGLKDELTETMLLVGDYSYYGKGAEKQQAEHDKWMVAGSEKIPYAQLVKEAGPWEF